MPEQDNPELELDLDEPTEEESTEEGPGEPSEEPSATEPADDRLRKAQEAMERRYDELVRQREEATRKAAYYEGLLAAKQEPKPEKDPNSEPIQSNYEKWEDWAKDWAQWSARDAIKAERETLFKELELRDRRRAYEARVRGISREEFPDFDEVRNARGLAISETMRDAIFEAEDLGPRIHYYLGKHPDEAMRIYQLPAGKQQYEIGRIVERLGSGGKLPTREPSKAPQPIAPVGGGGGGKAAKDPAQMTDAEWHRYEQARAARRRRQG